MEVTTESMLREYYDTIVRFDELHKMIRAVLDSTEQGGIRFHLHNDLGAQIVVREIRQIMDRIEEITPPSIKMSRAPARGKAKDDEQAPRQPKMGDRATCAACGYEIEYVGPYWRHVDMEFRHIAVPREAFAVPREACIEDDNGDGGEVSNDA